MGKVMKSVLFVRFIIILIFSQQAYSALLEGGIELLEDGTFSVDEGDWPKKSPGRSLKLVSVEKISAIKIKADGVTHSISILEAKAQYPVQELSVNWNAVDTYVLKKCW